MNDRQLRKAGKLFWGIIALLLSVSVALYFYEKQQYSLLILATVPILTFGGYILGAKTKHRGHYYPINLIEYVIENLLFFLLFMFSLFFLRDYISIKIILFLIMSAVGIFNTYSIIKVYNKTENA